MNSKTYEVLIIGGSYAGLSAAMALGRSLRNVLVIDAGDPCNKQTPHSHNFLTQDGKTPKEIATLAQHQVGQYPTVEVCKDLAVSGQKTETGFEVATQSGQLYQAKKLIFATGIKDQMPAIEGFAQCWGISVVHCPYCHGYEAKNRRTVIMASVEHAAHLAPMVYNLSEELSIVPVGEGSFSEQELEALERNRVSVVQDVVEAIEHRAGFVQQLHFKSGKTMAVDVVYAPLPFQQHSDIPASLGCEFTEMGHLQVDGFQKTSVEGVFACGDNSTFMRSVANAVANGNAAGAVVNKELCMEAF